MLALLPGSPAAHAMVAIRPKAPALHADQVAAAAQCNMAFGAHKWSDKLRATEVMNGYVNLGQYGHFTLAANPDWQPVSTLDSSGKGHMHSLHYLLPLLRRGVNIGDPVMINRFYYLLKDWVHDNPPGGRSSKYAWGPPIYEGFRSLVLVCAAAGPHGQAPWLLKALKRHGEMEADYRRYEGVNNASLHQSMGLYAIAVTLGRPQWRQIAIDRMRSLAVKLIHDDGSDEEGALSYAVNDYTWFGQAAERLRRAGDAVPAELNRSTAMPAFIAQATRPDGKLEALGDTTPAPLRATMWAGTPAEFVATSGVAGVAPTSTFAAYAGGYVFGRSGWGTGQRPLADETYYSVRAGIADHVPHAHDDQGALTLYSHGSELLYDTGQWRYTYGATRSFVVSRAAHNVVVVNGVRRSNPRPELTTTQAPGLDITTITDRGYDGVTLTRSIAYDRVDDVVVVWDRVSSATPVTASQQWGLGRDRGVSVEGDAVHSDGPGANVSMLFTSGGAPLDLKVGQQTPLRGWNSQSYGELTPAPSVRASQRGSELSWLTVLAPRAADVPSTAFTATASVSAGGASVALTTPAGNATVNLDPTTGSRLAAGAAAPIVPAAVATASIIPAGTSSTVRGRGLVPGAAVSMQSLPVGTTTWLPVASGTASAAGTVSLPLATTPAVVMAADYRLVTSSSAPTAPVRVTAALPPQPPVAVTAVSSGPGQVTVAWQPPVDTGGVPLGNYRVSIDGRSVTVPATALTAVVTGVRAGDRVVDVRADNGVGSSAAAALPVVVPAYPLVVAPVKVRKHGVATITATGLVPRQPVSVLVQVPGGSAITRTVVAAAAGTVKVKVKLGTKSVYVVATSAGVASPPVVILVR